jgi:Ras-related protein Rab-32
MNEFCQDKGFIGWFETSAKDDINVEQAAKFLVSKILEKEDALKQEEEKQTTDKLVLGQENIQPKKSRCCN